MRVLVSGASGFVGRHLCRELIRKGTIVRGVSRSEGVALEQGTELVVLPDITDRRAVKSAMAGVTAVVHLAARVHVMHERASDPALAFQNANVEATRALCEMARLERVSRFIYLSSMKVHGDGGEVTYSESDPLDPCDAYARSKRDAEAIVSDVLAETVHWTILRPPLVYGAGVKGNFRRLLTLAIYAGRVPLPLGGIPNRRSMVYVGNLVDAIIRCLEFPSSESRALIVSDGEDLSTSALLEHLASALGGKLPLAPCPVTLLRAVLRALGMVEESDRLFESFMVDSSAIRRELGWTPPFSVHEGLTHTARWFEGYRHREVQSWPL